MDALYFRRIETVGLSLRTSNLLRRHHIDTVGDLLYHSKRELLHIQGFGKASWSEVEKLMVENGLECKTMTYTE